VRDSLWFDAMAGVSSRSLSRSVPLGIRSVERRPQSFEIVERSLFGRKDVNDHVPEIDENPRTVGISLDAGYAVALASHRLDDRVGYCARLNLRTSGNDCERVRKNRSAAYVERREGFTFLVERALADDVDQLADA
jgi:hypothetical protein